MKMQKLSIFLLLISIICLLQIVKTKPNRLRLKNDSYKKFSVLLKDKEKKSKFCIDIKNLHENVCENKKKRLFRASKYAFLDDITNIQGFDRQIMLNQTCDSIWDVITNQCDDFANMGKIGDWFLNVIGIIKQKTNGLGDKSLDKAKTSLTKATRDLVKALNNGKKNNGKI